jgi:sensor histidine kinase YesM
MKAEKRKNTLMKRIIKYFLVIIMCMAVLNAYSSFKFKSFYGDIYTRLTRLVDIYSVSLNTDKLHKNIDNYAHSGSEEYLDSYDKEYKILVNLIMLLKNNTSGDDYYFFGDIHNMILSFDEESQSIISQYDNNVQQIYINESISDLTKIKGYIDDEVKNMLVKQLGSIMNYYEMFFNDIRKRENMIYFMIALITLFCIIAAVRFSRDISKPIHQLVLRHRKVAKGDFEVEVIEIKKNDEISELIESYNYMTVKIQKLIEEIKAKADVEKELIEQQMQNLEMSNLLNQSELKFLQSQINPHFLYNTLNSISALAIIEGAGQTMKMIGCISEIMKYYLKKINENVTLMEEFKIVENYLYIQEARFGDRMEFKLYYDEEVMGYSVPSMILQPFVENAIIHGLEPKEEKGRINVSVLDAGKDILILVEDNGVGIGEETLKDLLQKVKNQEVSPSKGIGVSNVIRRLELKYGKNIVDIYSSSGKGTEIKIRLPKAI